MSWIGVGPRAYYFPPIPRMIANTELITIIWPRIREFACVDIGDSMVCQEERSSKWLNRYGKRSRRGILQLRNAKSN